jgi:chemotaxis protein MotB
MSDDSPRPIIVKRIKKTRHGGHSGAWKIAYADFVTAMMAFFLLMWLLGSTTRSDLAGIAEYFKTPLRVALQGGSNAGQTSNVIKGGGRDLTRPDGESTKPKRVDLQATKKALEMQELAKLKALKAQLEKDIEVNPLLKQFKKQILIDITTEGLRIQIVDEQNRPMFDLGSAHLKPYTTQVLHEIGKVLNEVPNRISLSGHTDATPYSSGEKSYSNWELSADRANASRRELVAGGMDESKILRVVGLASAVMLDKDDPFNPINRRISLIVMNKRTEEAITKGVASVDVNDREQVSAALQSSTQQNPQIPPRP